MSNQNVTNKEQLRAALLLHSEWIGSSGRGGERLSGAGKDLAGADMRGANLAGARLEGAYLRGANLEGAYLRGARLEGAYLAGANLRGANLAGANLRGANLRGANLNGAILRGANLAEAILAEAILAEANLEGANLAEAILDFPIYAYEDGEPESWHDRYQMLYAIKDGELIIICGCRWMPVAEALAYWGSPNYHRGQELGAKKVALVNKIVEGVANGTLPPNSQANQQSHCAKGKMNHGHQEHNTPPKGDATSSSAGNHRGT